MVLTSSAKEYHYFVSKNVKLHKWVRHPINRTDSSFHKVSDLYVQWCDSDKQIDDRNFSLLLKMRECYHVIRYEIKIVFSPQLGSIFINIFMCVFVDRSNKVIYFGSFCHWTLVDKKWMQLNSIQINHLDRFLCI